ncbi:PAC2 family protein [Aestuariimicrobium ganziense]|uniref:PAC2 family protein n=1 Tax=Aestuariimicrobium ganziense TaxID=2773677 RepID=UPI00194398F5|nr:PAC2 family protein [Aestuariimicrobium ganziense]
MAVSLSTLRSPVVLLAFSGWNDAGEAATGVVEHLKECYDTEDLDALDSEDYYDFSQSRPLVQTDPVTENRILVWPGTELFLVRLVERDLVVVIGREPNMRWRSYCDDVLRRLDGLRPEMVVALGCMITDDPHTRPLPVYASSPDLAVRDRFGAQPETYQGPTGITGVMARAFADQGYDTLSLWGTTPHYSTRHECPKSTLALLRRLGEVVDEDLVEGDLPMEAAQWAADVSEVVADDTELSSYVASLEEAQDEGLGETTGDDIAAEFQRYLRRERREPNS